MRAYGRAYRTLQASFDALSAQVERMENPSQNQLRRLAAMRALSAQIEEQVGRFGAYAEQVIANRLDDEMAAGLADAEALVRASLPGGEAVMARVWNRLPIESVETMVGMTGADSPLRDALVNKLGPAVAETAVEALVTGIALGKNPRVIARSFMGQGLQWALTTARTAQLNAYRTASRASYMANSRIVSGWKWMATFDRRTCVSCLAMHGTTHPVDEQLNDHHNGRCVQIPIVPLAEKMGIAPPDLGDAEAYFKALPPADQKAIMGKGVLEGYNAGRWKFGDLTTTYEDHVYGTMRRAPTLESLEGMYA